MTTTLESLVTELFDEVLSLLRVPDLCRLRLSSRALEQRSRRTFRVAAFSNVRVDFSKENLQWLSEIASSDLRLVVRSLEVRDGCGSGVRAKPYGDGMEWPRLESGVVNPESRHVREFVDALSRFPNCTTANVTDLMVKGNPDDDRKELSSADAVELILHAYSTAGVPPIECFRMRITVDCDWPDTVVISEATVAAAQAVFASHLQELVLEFHPTEDRYDGYAMRILDLLTAAPKLKTLRLMLNYGEFAVDIGLEPRPYHLGWIFDVSPDFAPPLEHLTVGEMLLLPDQLFQLLAGCRDTLTSLSLFDLGLETGSWTDVLGFLRDGSFGKLRRIALHDIREAYFGLHLAFCPLWNARGQLHDLCGGTFEFVTIGPAMRARKKHVRGVIFEAEGTGPAMETGLRVIAEYSHRERHSEDPGSDACGGGTEMWRQQIIMMSTARNEAYERWTGLPVLPIEW